MNDLPIFDMVDFHQKNLPVGTCLAYGYDTNGTAYYGLCYYDEATQLIGSPIYYEAYKSPLTLSEDVIDFIKHHFNINTKKTA
jgi:hypothetical protein